MIGMKHLPVAIDLTRRLSAMRSPLLLTAVLIALPSAALAEGSGSGYHPFAPPQNGVRTVDLSTQGRAAAGSDYRTTPYSGSIPFDQLDQVAAEAAAAGVPATPPPGGDDVQGSVVVPGPIAAGELADPAVMHAVEDIPGNEYPRKHTLYLNFTGGMLYSGSDNSAESRSSLAQQGEYPAFTGGESTAIAAAQETANDVSQFGINVVYLERPPQIVPYTMVMIGGTWQDTNLEDSAAGVAPGTDCGALGQRHVVYTFANGGWSANAIANVNGQEAGHSWGLDHSLNCGSVMSYCGSGNGNFSDTCDGLCEAQCQGDAGCRLFHEDFCGVGADRQNEVEELAFLFGGNEPDLEPPTVEIVSPEDGAVLPAGSSVDLRALVDDNYGGYAWRFHIEHDGKVAYDQIDYDREVDDEYRAALNLVNLEPGTYVILMEIADHFDHRTTDTVTITIEPAAGDSDGPLDDSGGDDPGSGSASGDAGTPTGGENPWPMGTADDGEGTMVDPGVGDDGGAEGCSCRTDSGGRAPVGALLGLLGLLGLRRGQRRDRRGMRA